MQALLAYGVLLKKKSSTFFLICIIAKLKNQFPTETRIIYHLLKCLSLTRWTHLRCKIGTMSRCAFYPFTSFSIPYEIPRSSCYHTWMVFRKNLVIPTFHVLNLGISMDSEQKFTSIKINFAHHLITSSIYLRQSILLSAYETAETRSLYNSSLKNVAGKIRTERHWQPIAVPDGIDQVSLTVSWQGELITIPVSPEFRPFWLC